MKGKPMNEFERVWKQFQPFTENAELKECCEPFYRKGVYDGKESAQEIHPLLRFARALDRAAKPASELKRIL